LKTSLSNASPPLLFHNAPGQLLYLTFTILTLSTRYIMRMLLFCYQIVTSLF